MAYVITQNCCKDASCVSVCPVDCIRPTENAGTGTGPQMLFIDPDTCIDCGACYEECPVEAIHADTDLPPELEQYAELNAEYFRKNPLEPGPMLPYSTHPAVPAGSLRVAIVGAGPAACYAATELLAVGGVEVEMFDRLPVPFGLVRFGVAPDHQHTKSVVKIFESAFRNQRFTAHLNVDVGTTIDHDLLLANHHAVIYAVGAPDSRQLGIAGEGLPGHHPAADFIGWYNGHPDFSELSFDLTGATAVIIGNGNVAIDAARVLLMNRDTLEQTDIAEHAIEALSESGIEEVILVGRRGTREAAYSVGEFLALGHLDGIDIVIETDDLEPRPDDDVETAAKLAAAREYAARPLRTGNKRIVFRFMQSPTGLHGDGRVTSIRLATNTIDEQGRAVTGTDVEEVPTGLVLRSIGYRGRPMPGLPFDDVGGVIPNDGGRVVTDGTTVPGVYVTGWIKRGPRGVIGTNRACAEETVTALLEDFDAGALPGAVGDHDALVAAMTERGADPIGWSGWRAIDAEEKARGSESGRPRVKLVSVTDLLAASSTFARTP
ncbi:FAD-dependent oxidoreductase [Gordonia sp. ABSL1-1]|uniref:FAD-dependent oxidoreductase n=1 Tax=Gordonia sp. ABSL1-1 TaxID=3053923 RepID=UPI0025734800|nr:FAD-dependent oxidoreductase [Gordonia sp. ABSL1-1]MDL9936210.1 FAD-dependent oxidoreductase [Gordonia sp. ABSL1-1]